MMVRMETAAQSEAWMLKMQKGTGGARVMVAKAEQYRAEARRLQERAGATVDEQTKLTLLGQARRWLDIANHTERYGFDEGSRERSCPS
ncbi:MAG TPA: hypothetical protein VNQ74_16025 [Burkholderiaceae bacterium]|nr:hypothetical protein [Burkholderiaceae bacterium]